jgi:lipopolysaccharide export system permease protein
MIFQRSLVRELSNAASAIFITLLTIVLTFSLVRLLGQAAAGQVANESVLALITFAALNNLAVLLQLTVFIAVLLALTRSYRDSEMVVWLSAGLGLRRWLGPVMKFAVPVAILVAVLSFVVAPWANRQSSEFRARFQQRTDVARVAPGQFRESADGTKVYFVENDGKGGLVGNVFVASLINNHLGLIVSATGTMETADNGDQFLVMLHGRRYEGVPGQVDFKLMQFDRYGVRIENTPPVFTSDDSMKIRSTLELIALDTPRALGELVWRAGLPLSVLCLALLAIPLSFVNPRAGRSANLMIALLVYFTYSNALTIVQNYTAQSRLPFVVSLWVIHIIVFIIAMLLIMWRNGIHRSFRVVLGDMLRRRMALPSS